MAYGLKAYSCHPLKCNKKNSNDSNFLYFLSLFIIVCPDKMKNK